jgi:hypothetical protein
MVAVSVGAGEVWSGEGTLVVARAGEERRVDLHGKHKAARATTRVPALLRTTPAPTVPPFLSRFSRRFLLHLTLIGRSLVVALEASFF